jgi:hypothetical protein
MHVWLIQNTNENKKDRGIPVPLMQDTGFPFLDYVLEDHEFV